jgi:hypothetical protein
MCSACKNVTITINFRFFSFQFHILSNFICTKLWLHIKTTKTFLHFKSFFFIFNHSLKLKVLRMCVRVCVCVYFACSNFKKKKMGIEFYLIFILIIIYFGVNHIHNLWSRILRVACVQKVLHMHVFYYIHKTI